MVSSPRTSLSLQLDQPETPLSHRDDSVDSLSQSDQIFQNSMNNKLKSGTQWLLQPFQQCCSSKSTVHQTSKSPFDAQCLKPELNRVNSLLKYFAFGVMFTNGILGFILFFIGLWSSFEQRKVSHMPTIKNKNTTSLNPFNFMGIVVCIFGLLVFLLCLISCLGINRENLNLLRISLIGQFLTLIIFLTSAIMIMVWGKNIGNKVGETMMIGLRTYYHVDEAWTAFFDKLHMSYFCCGVYSFNDWNDNPNYACTSDNTVQSLDACSVPFTCCKTEQNEDNRYIQTKSIAYTCGGNILSPNNVTVNLDAIQQRININGCFDEILPIIQQLIITAVIFMLLICIIIFVTIFLTCLLTFEIRMTISDVKRYCRKRKSKYKQKYSEPAEETF